MVVKGKKLTGQKKFESINIVTKSRLTDDEKIDVAARLILEKYKPALLELAK